MILRVYASVSVGSVKRRALLGDVAAIDQDDAFADEQEEEAQAGPYTTSSRLNMSLMPQT